MKGTVEAPRLSDGTEVIVHRSVFLSVTNGNGDFLLERRYAQSKKDLPGLGLIGIGRTPDKSPVSDIEMMREHYLMIDVNIPEGSIYQLGSERRIYIDRAIGNRSKLAFDNTAIYLGTHPDMAERIYQGERAFWGEWAKELGAEEVNWVAIEELRRMQPKELKPRELEAMEAHSRRCQVGSSVPFNYLTIPRPSRLITEYLRQPTTPSLPAI